MLLNLIHSLPFILRRKIEKEEHQKFSLNFCFLTLVITLSYELEIEYSNAKIVGLEESYKLQAFSESFELVIVHSKLFFSPSFIIVC